MNGGMVAVARGNQVENVDLVSDSESEDSEDVSGSDQVWEHGCANGLCGSGVPHICKVEQCQWAPAFALASTSGSLHF